MSIVVGVAKQGRVVLASDTQSNFGSEIIPEANHVSRKIRRVGDVLLGRTGWGIYENILDDVLQAEKPPDLGSSEAVFRFFTGLWKRLRKDYSLVNERAGRKDSPFGDLGGSFLVGAPAGLFYVSPNLGVSRFTKYYAIGSGADYALGALHATYDGPEDATSLARRGVETAAAFNVHCGGGIDSMTLD